MHVPERFFRTFVLLRITRLDYEYDHVWTDRLDYCINHNMFTSAGKKSNDNLIYLNNVSVLPLLFSSILTREAFFPNF